MTPRLSPSTTIFGRSSAPSRASARASLSNHILIGTGTSANGDQRVRRRNRRDSSILTIGAGFFTTMQIPLLMGREIEERDRPGSPMVAVVNEAFARRSFGDRNPLGQHLACSTMCPKCDIEIVGVSANTLYGNLKGTGAADRLSAVRTGRLGARAGDGV